MYIYDYQGIPKELMGYFSKVCMKGGSAASTAPSYYDRKMADIALKEYEQTQPLRDLFIQDWQQTMEGGVPKFAGTIYSGLKAPIESQYDVAKEDILSALPAGGALEDQLANLEVARAEGLSGALQNIFSDQMAKAYGYTTGAPQQAISGLQTPAQDVMAARMNKLNAMVQSSGQPMSMCCWNFLASLGYIADEVKWYRDEHYPKGCPVSKGYKWMSEFAVPLMKKYKWFKKFIEWIMARPMTKYAQWYYGKNSYGWAFKPIVNFWVTLWGEWGKLPEAQKYYQERNHGTCGIIS